MKKIVWAIIKIIIGIILSAGFVWIYRHLAIVDQVGFNIEFVSQVVIVVITYLIADPVKNFINSLFAPKPLPEYLTPVIFDKEPFNKKLFKEYVGSSAYDLGPIPDWDTVISQYEMSRCETMDDFLYWYAFIRPNPAKDSMWKMCEDLQKPKIHTKLEKIQHNSQKEPFNGQRIIDEILGGYYPEGVMLDDWSKKEEEFYENGPWKTMDAYINYLKFG